MKTDQRDAPHVGNHPGSGRVRLMRFEHRHQRPITSRQFARRMIGHSVYAGLVVAGSLFIGAAGYRVFAGFSWVDSLLNSAMLLGGMGPVGDIPTTSGKLFAAAFALYAGLVFLAVAALLLGPVFHRVLHRFHFEAEQESRE